MRRQSRPRSRTARAVVSAGMIAVLVAAIAGCSAVTGSPDPRGRPSGEIPLSLPEPVRSILAQEHGFVTRGSDTIEVVVCVVPLTTTATDFEPGMLRLDLTPVGIANLLTAHVAPYFDDLSGGAYHPRFVAGDTITLGDAEGPTQCLDRALAASASTSLGVLAIGTAENRAGSNGGRGTPGSACAADASWPCPAAQTGRSAYVGASDFHPDWGPVPALDLVEHELGHLLGWPHSGLRDRGYASALDVMSDSAAPRETDAGARDAQGTLAINRVAAGWIGVSDVAMPQTGDTVQLRASGSASGTRLAVLPVDAQRFLTVEYLVADDLQSHLPRSGVTVTLVDLSACAECALAGRTQETLVGAPPFTDLLTDAGDSWSGWGWTVTLASDVAQTAGVSIIAG